MILPKPQNTGVIAIDLTGPEGNAFYLMGLARALCRAANVDPDPVVARMKSGDYENLVQVFDQEFGDMVVMYR